MPRGRVTLRWDDRDHAVDVLDDGQVRVGDETWRVSVEDARFRVDGLTSGPAWAIASGDSRWVYHDGIVYELDVQSEGGRRRSRQAGSLAAPMPATVRQIRVAVGDAVAEGDILIVLEAMKMELPVKATVAGIVAALHCREGELVQPGRPLIDLTETAGG